MITRAVLFLSLGAAALASGMTEQWRYESSNEIYQVYADGNGGCALAIVDTNDVQTIIWLDKKGKVFFQTVLTNNVRRPIVYCTAKQLMLHDERERSVILVIDTKGQVTTLDSADRDVQDPFLNMLLPENVTVDKKGFFGFLFKPCGTGNTVIRYKNN